MGTSCSYICVCIYVEHNIPQTMMICVSYQSVFVSVKGRVEQQTRTQTLTSLSGLGWDRVWCSTRGTRQKVWCQPDHVVLVHM